VGVISNKVDGVMVAGIVGVIVTILGVAEAGKGLEVNGTTGAVAVAVSPEGTVGVGGIKGVVGGREGVAGIIGGEAAEGCAGTAVTLKVKSGFTDLPSCKICKTYCPTANFPNETIKKPSGLAKV
jgi:hypothetical protein